MFWYTFTPFSRKLGSRSCTFPILRSLSSRYTPSDLWRGKSFKDRKKKPKSRKRFCSPTSLASSLGAKQRRKVEKRAETQICAHLYTSLVPQAVNGELKGYFLAYFSDLLRVCSLFAHRVFLPRFDKLSQEPSHEIWPLSDCGTVSMTRLYRSFEFTLHFHKKKK